MRDPQRCVQHGVVFVTPRGLPWATVASPLQLCLIFYLFSGWGWGGGGSVLLCLFSAHTAAAVIDAVGPGPVVSNTLEAVP